jgi:Tubulin-tyrosine ligase family
MYLSRWRSIALHKGNYNLSSFMSETNVHVAHMQVLPTQHTGLNVWIVKPSCLSRGRGVHVIDDSSKVTCEQPSVIQRYVASPLLLHGHKFDLRIYVCVTCFNPLEAFLHHVRYITCFFWSPCVAYAGGCTCVTEHLLGCKGIRRPLVVQQGFARVALKPYSADTISWSDPLVHLTNSSIQFGSLCSGVPVFLQSCDGEPYGGNKMSLDRMWSLIGQHSGVQKSTIWPRVRECVLAALFSAQDAIPSQVITSSAILAMLAMPQLYCFWRGELAHCAGEQLRGAWC